jgi:hypothetical protein
MVSYLSKPQKRVGTWLLWEYKCWIVMAAPASPLPAQSADISDSGAKLLVLNPKDVPDEFTLHLTENGVGQAPLSGGMAWR